PHEFRRSRLLPRLLTLRLRWAAHVCDRQAAQHLLDAFAHTAQRLAHGAALGLVALAALIAVARRDKQRTVDRLDHFERRGAAPLRAPAFTGLWCRAAMSASRPSPAAAESWQAPAVAGRSFRPGPSR